MEEQEPRRFFSFPFFLLFEMFQLFFSVPGLVHCPLFVIPKSKNPEEKKKALKTKEFFHNEFYMVRTKGKVFKALPQCEVSNTLVPKR